MAAGGRGDMGTVGRGGSGFATLVAAGRALFECGQEPAWRGRDVLGVLTGDRGSRAATGPGPGVRAQWGTRACPAPRGTSGNVGSLGFCEVQPDPAGWVWAQRVPWALCQGVARMERVPQGDSGTRLGPRAWLQPRQVSPEELGQLNWGPAVTQGFPPKNPNKRH